LDKTSSGPTKEVRKGVCVCDTHTPSGELVAHVCQVFLEVLDLFYDQSSVFLFGGDMKKTKSTIFFHRIS